MTKERRLGRGLEALLGKPVEPPGYNDAGDHDPGSHDAGDQTGANEQAYTPPLGEPISDGGEPNNQAEGAIRSPVGYQEVSVYEIDANPYQPRQEFDEEEIESLAASIQQHGLLQPVIVRQAGDRYQLISGERRLRAAIKSGWTRLPAKVVEVEERQVAELAIVENLQRKDLNPLEKALSFDEYLRRYGCTQEELAARLDIDRSTIANLIRLLELPGPVQDALRGGQITQGHARALLPLGDEQEQCQVCEQIWRESLSVRATESIVQELIQAADAEPFSIVGGDAHDEQPRRVRNDQISMLEQELRVALGTKVEIRQSARGRGKIVVHFKNNDEFGRLNDLFRQAGGQEPARHAG